MALCFPPFAETPAALTACDMLERFQLELTWKAALKTL